MAVDDGHRAVESPTCAAVGSLSTALTRSGLRPQPQFAVTSPFLKLPQDRWVAANDLAFAIRDGYPVSPGHTLVVPHRLIATWFDATTDEQVAIFALVEAVKRQLDTELRPDGYNIGINAGAAAGQTVPHLHVHVIPRFAGDVADPRGGVRHVIPGKGNYLATNPIVDARREALVTGGTDDPFLRHVQPLFAKAKRISILAAFCQHRGVEEGESMALAAADRGAEVRLLTGDYLNITQRSALAALLGWMAHDVGDDGCAPQVRIVEAGKLATLSRSFHPKAWRFEGDNLGVAFVGSSNVSSAALHDGIEWNLRVDRDRDPAAYGRVVQAFEAWWLQARPLDSAFVQSYRDRPAFGGDAQAPQAELAPEAQLPPPEPHQIQREALDQLAQSRAQGRQRALVVMATGLGKTWLAAFDLLRHCADLGRTPRMLFVAHRDELLRQAARTFRRQFDDADVGFFAGTQNDLDAQFVFASVQKLSLAPHLSRLADLQFDYAVIDEVHHATAASYRRVLGALQAGFVLGLTATPERSDSADVEGLFDDHVAYRADIGRGIESDHLTPFHYFGLKDETNYAAIPWRNGRFDPQALAIAVQTQARMAKAWQGWQEHPGTRTLVFCCTIAHARFVSRWLADQGVRVCAVHSEADSSDRVTALQQLEAGELDAVCAVDLFNEGIDVPLIDRVVMLRPSESPVVFLQQLGRGLRRADGKTALTVIDFVGNHRVFLQRLRTLLDTAPETAVPVELGAWLADAALRRKTELPPGCSINVELEAIDLLASLLPRGDQQVALRAFRDFVQTHGRRPTAGELYRLGYNPRIRGQVAWFALVASEGQLTEDQQAVMRHAGDFLADLCTTPMTKCFKMLVLQALVEADAVAMGLPLAEVCTRGRAILARDPMLAADLRDVQELGDFRQCSASQWRAYWRRNPIAAWLGENAANQRRAWFALDGEQFAPRIAIDAALREALTAMVAELVDWRLAEYRNRPRVSQATSATAFECKLTHANGNPILKHPGVRVLPWVGQDVEVQLPDGSQWMFGFRKEFCNTAWPRDTSGANQLPTLMRQWFGPDAGLPGTQFRVQFWQEAGAWRVRPMASDDARIVPLAPRVSVRALPTLQVAAGWAPDNLDANGALDVEQVALPGPLPAGCVAVRASGISMAGWRSEIADGDWLVLRLTPGQGLAALEGKIAVIARGADEAVTLHCKRVVRGPDGRWLLRSDASDVEPMLAEPGDRPIGEVVRVVKPEAMAPPVGAQVRSVARAFGLSREPNGRADRVDGHLFVLGDKLISYDRFVSVQVDRRPGETAFVLLDRGDGAHDYAGVGRWDAAHGNWAIPEVGFETWRRFGGGRSASRALTERHLDAARLLVERLVAEHGIGGWVAGPGKGCRLVGRAAQGGIRIDGGPGGFAERTVSLVDVGWVLAAGDEVERTGERFDEGVVNRLRYLAGTPVASTRFVDTGWAVVLVAANPG